ncbi:MAG: hypothetical protein WKF73_07885 [Nocardioidaceae bacterium]
MLAAGARVVLGDDDPVTTGSPLSEERRVLDEEMGLSRADRVAMSEAAVDAAFCDEVTREVLRRADDKYELTRPTAAP